MSTEHDPVDPARAVVSFSRDDPAPEVSPDVSTAEGAWEALDVEDGECESAWTGDGEVLHLGLRDGRGGPRPVLLPTGTHDLPGLVRRLAVTRPELAGADREAVHRFVVADLAEQEAWRRSRPLRRLGRWVRGALGP